MYSPGMAMLTLPAATSSSGIVRFEMSSGPQFLPSALPASSKHVAGRAMRIGVITEFRDVDRLIEGGAIQRFHVLETDRKLQAFEIDPAVDDRVEHEAIVRAGRKPERELHAPSSTSVAVRHKAATASSMRQAPRLRRSTAFDTARTCANGAS